MKDRGDIIPLLHDLRRVTFFTHDLGFFDPSLCHKRYALICLDVKLLGSDITIITICHFRSLADQRESIVLIFA